MTTVTLRHTWMWNPLIFLVPADQPIRNRWSATPNLVNHHNLTLLCDSDCLPICIFRTERSNFATFRHGHPSRASPRVPGYLKHLVCGLYAPEPIVSCYRRAQRARNVPHRWTEHHQRIQAALRSCSWITVTSQHILLCQLVWFFTLSGSFMGKDEDPWWGFFAMKYMNRKTQFSVKSFDVLFGTFSNRFSHSIQIDKSSCTQLPARSGCFCLLTELVHWSCSSKLMCPLINLALQGMVVEGELPVKFWLYCF